MKEENYILALVSMNKVISNMFFIYYFYLFIYLIKSPIFFTFFSPSICPLSLQNEAAQKKERKVINERNGYKFEA